MSYKERVIETSISRSNLEAALIASGLLNSFGIIHGDEDITHLVLGSTDQDSIPLKITIEKRGDTG